MELEYSLVKTPFEGLNRVFRSSQKNVEKEISQILLLVSELDKKKDKISKEEAAKSLDKLVTRLQGLKRKVRVTGGVQKQEHLPVDLDHLESIALDPLRVPHL